MAHTPGPWRYEQDDESMPEHGDACRYIRANETIMAGVRYYPWTPENEDDWKLIAAAPELLDAARDAQCDCSTAARESGHNIGCWFPALQAAIAKADGR